MFRNIIILVVIFAALFASGELFAKKVFKNVKDVSVTEEKSPDVDIHAVPPILDPNYRHKKRHQFEFCPYGGGYLGSTLGQTWVAGGRAYFHLNNTTALGVNSSVSKLLTNRDSTFGRKMVDTLLPVFLAEAMFSNDAAFRVGKKLMEMDFYATLGAGAMRLDGTWEPTGQIGGGVKFYVGIPWLAFRIDVNNYAHFSPMPGPDQFDFDVLFLGGISFLFPSHPSAYEK